MTLTRIDGAGQTCCFIYDPILYMNEESIDPINEVLSLATEIEVVKQ